jgi:hypothetical protein
MTNHQWEARKIDDYLSQYKYLHFDSTEPPNPKRFTYLIRGWIDVGIEKLRFDYQIPEETWYNAEIRYAIICTLINGLARQIAEYLVAKKDET